MRISLDLQRNKSKKQRSMQVLLYNGAFYGAKFYVLITTNTIKNFPVTIEGMDNTEIVFGPDNGTMKRIVMNQHFWKKTKRASWKESKSDNAHRHFVFQQHTGINKQ